MCDVNFSLLIIAQNLKKIFWDKAFKANIIKVPVNAKLILHNFTWKPN